MLPVKLAERMETWLVEGGRTPQGDNATRRIDSLQALIRRESMELIHLVRLAEAIDLAVVRHNSRNSEFEEGVIESAPTQETAARKTSKMVQVSRTVSAK